MKWKLQETMTEPRRSSASSGEACLFCHCFGDCAWSVRQFPGSPTPPGMRWATVTVYSMCRCHRFRRSLACKDVAKAAADKQSPLRRLLGAPKEADSYAIMGLEPDAKGADVKRRYMRLSLLIHPDKCSHPQAQHAFQAVSKASKVLQACPEPPYRLTTTAFYARAHYHLPSLLMLLHALAWFCDYWIC